MLKRTYEEAQAVQEKLRNVKRDIEDTLKKQDQVETDYFQAKSEFERKKIRLGRLSSDIEYNIHNLDTQIEQMETKIRGLQLELPELEASFQESSFELAKIKSETSEVDNKTKKSLKILQESLKKAADDLAYEKELDVEIEKTYDELKKKRVNEIKEKLVKVEKNLAMRFKKAEAKYKSKADPLLEYVQNLDDQIDHLYEEIDNQPKTLQKLREKNIALSQKLQKVFDSRMLLETNSITKALFEALIYIKEHPESLMKDVIFGILLGRANLQWAITNLKPHFNYEYLFKKKLRDMIGICDYIIEINKTETSSVLNPSLWRNAAEDLKIDTLHLQDEQIRLPKLYSCQNIFSYMMKGTPENSDFCINDLFESTCQVSDKCWFSEANKSFHSGYKTSHRLIYLQLATRLNCDKKNIKKFSALKERKKKLCEQMLLEARALRKENYFLLTRDLFLEQIALCGFEGYSEFANKIWRNEVVRWQSEEGCFGQDMPHVNNCSMNILEADNHPKKLKRTDSIIDKCHTHVTAVAISAMAFHLRFVLSMGLL